MHGNFLNNGGYMKRLVLFMIGFIFLLSGTANASLIVKGADSLGNQLIYDDDLNITFYDIYYENRWDPGVTWLRDLEVTFEGQIYDDWQLPSPKNFDGSGPYSGANLTETIFGHLWYTEFGNVAYQIGPKNTGVFNNLDDFNNYWLGGRYAGIGNPYCFMYYYGLQGTSNSYNSFQILPVRSGDVGASSVPIPGAIWLFGAGLIGLLGIKRRQNP